MLAYWPLGLYFATDGLARGDSLCGDPGVLGGGCVERTITVDSDPPGALVYLNNQEAGRTPFTRNFVWYGDYEIQLRKDGYETLDTHRWVIAPIYEWAPLDLVAELALPSRSGTTTTSSFNLARTTGKDENPNALIDRAQVLRGQLQSSDLTRKPATQAATTKASATQAHK